MFINAKAAQVISQSSAYLSTVAQVKEHMQGPEKKHQNLVEPVVKVLCEVMLNHNLRPEHFARVDPFYLVSAEYSTEAQATANSYSQLNKKGSVKAVVMDRIVARTLLVLTDTENERLVSTLKTDIGVLIN